MENGRAMPPHASSSQSQKHPIFRVVVLHDDYVTAQRGKRVAGVIADEMGLGNQCEMTLWNIDLFDTLFGRVAAVDASAADIVIVALRATADFSGDLKRWLGRWLTQKRDSSAALIVVFESHRGPAAKRARAFVERAAQDTGKDFFTQSSETEETDELGVREFLWVL